MAGVSDPAASVLARLKSKAKARGIPYQSALQLFCQEEFLRRLAASRFADRLVLKGGMFLYAVSSFASRPTVDVDFLLQRHANALAEVEGMIEEIAAVETGNGFVSFEATGAHMIAANRVYHGVHMQLIGRIKKTRTPVELDIGVGDVIVPEPSWLSVPVQLNGFESPRVLSYSIESTIAEKVHAMIQYKEFGSRMKDYHDVSFLSRRFDFDGEVLGEAIVETFRMRRTKLTMQDFDDVIALATNAVMNDRWRRSVVALNLSKASFSSALSDIEAFVGPVWHAVVHGDVPLKRWDSARLQWF